jgi:hypothetical protein
VIRAVLDTDGLVAALLARDGAPAAIVRALHDGRFDFVACPSLLDELARVLARPRIACRVEPTTAAACVDWLRRICVFFPDPERIARVSPDPDDDYLIALAQAAAAHVLVSGGRGPQRPCRSPGARPSACGVSRNRPEAAVGALRAPLPRSSSATARPAAG